MALIKCPECGHDISEHSSKCIYCGKELFHCPECGKTTVRHGNTCPNCGYELPAAPDPSAPAASAQPAPDPAPQTDLIKAWGSACPAEAKRKKVLWGVFCVINIVAMIPMILLALHVLFDFIFPLGEEALSELPLSKWLTYFSDCRNFINDTFTASVVLGCLATVADFFICYRRVIPIANWLKKDTFDVAGYLNKEEIRLNEFFAVGKKAEQREGYWAAYCAFSPKGKIGYGISCFHNLTPIIMIFLSMALYDYAIDRLDCVIADAGDSPAFPWISVILLAVLFVIDILVIFICGHFCKKFLKSYAAQSEQKS